MTTSSKTIASLAMYPFDPLRLSWQQLWDGVRSRLPFEAPPLNWEIDPDVACRRDDLLLGQSCGWPLVTDLADIVHVVGTFDCDVEDAVDGTTRSLLVSGIDASVDDVLGRSDLKVAANSRSSLSGWISLQAAALDRGVVIDVDNVVWTGAHVRSIDALQRGQCHLAAIDAVSWAHLRPHLQPTKLFVIGHGPRIPCLPLVTSRSAGLAVRDELRNALAGAVADPALGAACATLKVHGFLERDLSDYQRVTDLLELS